MDSLHRTLAAGNAAITISVAGAARAEVDLAVLRETPAPVWENPHAAGHPQASGCGLWLIAPVIRQRKGVRR